jgi:glutamine synthetase adenylyltransferase
MAANASLVTSKIAPTVTYKGQTSDSSGLLLDTSKGLKHIEFAPNQSDKESSTKKLVLNQSKFIEEDLDNDDPQIEVIRSAPQNDDREEENESRSDDNDGEESSESESSSDGEQIVLTKPVYIPKNIRPAVTGI